MSYDLSEIRKEHSDNADNGEEVGTIEDIVHYLDNACKGMPVLVDNSLSNGNDAAATATAAAELALDPPAAAGEPTFAAVAGPPCAWDPAEVLGPRRVG